MITYLNKAALNLAKAKNTCLIVGRPIADFVHPSNREFVLNRVKHATEKDSTEPVIQKFINLDGETIYAETSTAVIPRTRSKLCNCDAKRCHSKT